MLTKANVLKIRIKSKPVHKTEEKSSITAQQHFTFIIGALSVPCTSHLDPTLENGSPRDIQGGNVNAATAYPCLRLPESYQGKSMFTQQEPITLKTCRSCPPPLVRYKADSGVKREKQNRPNMRENPSSVSSQNMAFTDCMKSTDLSADKKGIK